MIDTNIIVSAMLFRSGGISLLLKEIIRKYEICVCTFSIEELHLVMQKKFRDHLHEMDDFLSDLAYELIYTPKKLNIESLPYVRDKKDCPVLAAAIAADADILLSGDKDLLAVEIDRPEILSPKSFREKFLV